MKIVDALKVEMSDFNLPWCILPHPDIIDIIDMD